ncbi:MAG: hypothetical protein AAF518_26805 [Spirochaetota bacterium]
MLSSFFYILILPTILATLVASFFAIALSLVFLKSHVSSDKWAGVICFLFAIVYLFHPVGVIWYFWEDRGLLAVCLLTISTAIGIVLVYLLAEMIGAAARP